MGKIYMIGAMKGGVGKSVSVFNLFYPQLGVKFCSMAGGGVQKSIWCF